MIFMLQVVVIQRIELKDAGNGYVGIYVLNYIIEGLSSIAAIPLLIVTVSGF